MLTDHQWSIVKFIWEQFHTRYLSHWSLKLIKLAWKLLPGANELNLSATLFSLRKKDQVLIVFVLVFAKNLISLVFSFHWFCVMDDTQMVVKPSAKPRMTASVDALTHWGPVTHICVSKVTIIGSDNGLSPGRRQAIIWTNAGILLIRTLGTKFSEILSEIHAFSLKKMHLKISSAKWRPFCLGLNVLNFRPNDAFMC